MPAPIDEIRTLEIKDLRLDQFAHRFPLWSRIRVLVVADTSVQTSESGGFGVGRFIKLLPRHQGRLQQIRGRRRTS